MLWSWLFKKKMRLKDFWFTWAIVLRIPRNGNKHFVSISEFKHTPHPENTTVIIKPTFRTLHKPQIKYSRVAWCIKFTFGVIQFRLAHLSDLLQELRPSKSLGDARPKKHRPRGEPEQCRPCCPWLLLLLGHQTGPVHINYIQRSCRHID